MKPTLKIESFKKWYFDGDTKKSEGETLIENLIKNDKVSITIQDIFNNCGYIPAEICENLTDEQKKEEELEFDPSEVDFIHSEVEKFARKDTKTGKGMNSGFCVGDGDAYFEEDADLIEYIREHNKEAYEGLSDEFLLKDSYESGYHYWTEWEVTEGETWYDANGNEFNN